jgi:hypothetical protein
MGETMKFAGLQGEDQPKTDPERAFLARPGANVGSVRSASLIFNQMPICSARP